MTAGYIGYLVAFLFACLIGSQGPKPFTTNGAGETFNSTIRSGSTHSENRVSQLEGLSPANQFIIVECPIKNTLWQTYGEAFEYDLDVMVTARAYRDTAAVRENEYVTLENELEFTRTVRCEAKEPWCNDIIIFGKVIIVLTELLTIKTTNTFTEKLTPPLSTLFEKLLPS